MKITLKLFSELAEYLPPGADGNVVEVAADESASAHDIIARFSLPQAEVRVMMVNGEFLPPDKRDLPLADGDVVSVWPAVQGG